MYPGFRRFDMREHEFLFVEVGELRLNASRGVQVHMTAQI